MKVEQHAGHDNPKHDNGATAPQRYGVPRDQGIDSGDTGKVARPRTHYGSPNVTDPFAPERFQIAQDYTTLVGGAKQITRVPVGRPDSQLWFHVNPDCAFTIDVALLDLRNERETYIVDPSLAMEVPTEVVTKRLFQYVTRQGDIGIWAIKLPDPEGRIDSYNESAMLAVETAQERWVRLVSN